MHASVGLQQYTAAVRLTGGSRAGGTGGSEGPPRQAPPPPGGRRLCCATAAARGDSGVSRQATRERTSWPASTWVAAGRRQPVACRWQHAVHAIPDVCRIQQLNTAHARKPCKAAASAHQLGDDQRLRRQVPRQRQPLLQRVARRPQRAAPGRQQQQQERRAAGMVGYRAGVAAAKGCMQGRRRGRGSSASQNSKTQCDAT